LPGDPLKGRDKTKVNVADVVAGVDAARKARDAKREDNVAKYAKRVREYWKREQGKKVWNVPIELKSSENPCALCGAPMPKRRKNPICAECVEKLKQQQEKLKEEMADADSQ